MRPSQARGGSAEGRGRRASTGHAAQHRRRSERHGGSRTPQRSRRCARARPEQRVIRKPLTTKKTSTPRKPPQRRGGSTTASTAMAAAVEPGMWLGPVDGTARRAGAAAAAGRPAGARRALARRGGRDARASQWLGPSSTVPTVAATRRPVDGHARRHRSSSSVAPCMAGDLRRGWRWLLPRRGRTPRQRLIATADRPRLDLDAGRRTGRRATWNAERAGRGSANASA